MTLRSGGRESPISIALKARPARFFIILFIALGALWPALWNGGPFYMADTPSYFRGAASVFFKLLHVKTQWTAEFLRLYQADAGPSAAAAPVTGTVPPADDPVTLSGRSVYYGILLYLGYLAGSDWVIVIVQTLLSSACLVLTVRLIGRAAGNEARPAIVLLIGLVTAAATSLGYFAGYLMPDLFTGIAVLALANLLFLSRWMARGEKHFWWGGLAYSLLVHSTNLMLCAAVVILWAIVGMLRRPRVNFAPLVGVVACVAVGAVGQIVFGLGVKAMTGHPPVRPPFIAMRLIADGPGYSYLQEHCSTDRYI